MPKLKNITIDEGDIILMDVYLTQSSRLDHKYAVRLQTMLCLADGYSSGIIAKMLRIDIKSVYNHAKRYQDGGIEALLCDKTRKPGTPPISEDVKNKVISLACNEKPEGKTHWSTRELSEKVGISHTTVNTILKERGIKPHLVKRFRFSTDEEFDSKLADVVGLYLDPPENSIVLCVDEKTQIQALERAVPILPLRPGIPERQTHDYIRHGTTTLFAAIDVVSGRVIGKCKRSHKTADYLDFLKTLDKDTPKNKTLHIIADNYTTHKTKAVKEYIAERNAESQEKKKIDRFVLHFIPTHSSWLNLIERWFAEITNKRIRRDSWNNVKELEKAILDFVIVWNKSGKTFRWTKSYDDIQNSIRLAKRNI